MDNKVKTIFDDDRMKVVTKKLGTLLGERLGKIEMGFVASGAPHPQSLLTHLGKVQTMLINMRRELILLGSVVKMMSLGLVDDQLEAVTVLSVKEVERMIDLIDEQTKPEKKSKIIQAGVIPPGLGGR